MPESLKTMKRMHFKDTRGNFATIAQICDNMSTKIIK